MYTLTYITLIFIKKEKPLCMILQRKLLKFALYGDIEDIKIQLSYA